MADLITQSSPQDGPVLHFLKGLPDRYLLMLALFIMTGFYAMFPVDAILQVVINIVIAIIALSQKKPEPQATNINSETTVQTDAVNTDQMDVTTDTVNLKEK